MDGWQEWKARKRGRRSGAKRDPLASTHRPLPRDDRVRVAPGLALQGDDGALADHELAVGGARLHGRGN